MAAIPGRIFLAAWLVAMAAAGCRSGADYMTPERLDRGLVFCLDGVGGYNWGPRWLRDGLDKAGVECAVHIFDWGHGPAGMFIADLMDKPGNRKRAAELAALVANYQKFYPGRPVYLIGHSGGAGVVVFALEEMDPQTMVDGVFLLAPAVDPERNLAPALRHVRGRCYATYSTADFPLMGLGTSLFSTMDGKRGVSAGLVGFRLPKDLTPEDLREYAKLLQAGWDGSLLKSGHLGGHMGWTSPGFTREYIAPIVHGEDPAPIFRPIEGAAGGAPATAVAQSAGQGSAR